MYVYEIENTCKFLNFSQFPLPDADDVKGRPPVVPPKQFPVQLNIKFGNIISFVKLKNVYTISFLRLFVSFTVADSILAEATFMVISLMYIVKMAYLKKLIKNIDLGFVLILIQGNKFLVDEGVILVTINYRLGALGFINFGEGPANLGLHDQLIALQWINENIQYFSGDKHNITLMGESAGAACVHFHMLSTLSAGDTFNIKYLHITLHMLSFY